jgi:ankyrin repeat protein
MTGDRRAKDELRQHIAERAERCPFCGYSLRHLASDRCPECGAGIERIARELASRGRSWIGFLALALAMLTSLFMSAPDLPRYWKNTLHYGWWERAETYALLAATLHVLLVAILLVLLVIRRKKLARLSPWRWGLVVSVGFVAILAACPLVNRQLSLHHPMADRSGDPFRDAVETGKLPLIKHTADRLDDVNFSKGKSTLLHVIAQGDTRLVRLLLDLGADPNIVVGRSSPLDAALLEWDATIYEMLLEAGADPHALTSHCRPSLWWAAGTCNFDIVCLLLERGAAIDERHEGKTPLLNVLEIRTRPNRDPQYDDVALLLLKAGADPDAIDPAGRSCLMLAAGGSEAKVLQALIARGAEVRTRDDQGRTALMYACERGDVENARHLLHAGADPNAVDRKGRTPLQLAFDAEDYALCRALVSAGADLSQLARGPEAIRQAARDQQLQRFTLLVEAQPTPQRTREILTTVLHQELAATTIYTGVVHRLAASGADIDAPLPSGRTPLEVAVRRSDNQLLRLLLLHGADPLAQTLIGEPVWNAAVQTFRAQGFVAAAGHPASPQRLDDAEACLVTLTTLGVYQVDAPLSDSAGETPLATAVRLDRPALVRALLAAGADPRLAHLNGIELTELVAVDEALTTTSLRLVRRHLDQSSRSAP